jgi:transcriptional regulator with XRE-family HTH domain
MVNESFSEWIIDEVQKRDWSYSELARQAGMSSAQVSMVVNGRSNPGEKFCRGVAHAFRVSPDIVFRKAGLLPDVPAREETEQNLLYKIRQLDPEGRERVAEFLEYLDYQRRSDRGTAPTLGDLAEADAYNFLRNGGKTLELQRLLGHTSLAMVKRYVAIAEVDLERAHRRASPVSNWDL